MADPPAAAPKFAPIALGADNLGHPLKEVIKAHLQEKGIDVVDFSAQEGTTVDYPDVAVEVARAVAEGRFTRAVLVCGTGIGMSIAANKVPGVRAANVADPYSAERARKSNDAQVLCLGSRVVSPDVSRLLIDHWLAAEFAAGESARKVAKLDALDGRRRVTGAARDAAEAR